MNVLRRVTSNRKESLFYLDPIIATILPGFATPYTENDSGLYNLQYSIVKMPWVGLIRKGPYSANTYKSRELKWYGIFSFTLFVG